MVKCLRCEKPIKRADRFCPYCGAKNPSYNEIDERIGDYISSHIGVILAGGCGIAIIILICVLTAVKSDPLDKYVDLAHYGETNTKPLTAEEMGVSEDYFREEVKPSKPMKIWKPTEKITPQPTNTPTPIPTPTPIMTKEEMDELTLPLIGK